MSDYFQFIQSGIGRIGKEHVVRATPAVFLIEECGGLSQTNLNPVKQLTGA
jgi:hypothetical protein